MVTPRTSSRQAAQMQQAQHPGLSGSGFASTRSGKLGLGPERTVLEDSTTQWIQRGEGFRKALNF